MEEGGTLLMPLNQRSLASLQEMLFVDAGEPRSLYDRINELMGEAGEFTIYNAWQETAKDLLGNPVLRDHKKATDKRNTREQVRADFWNGK
jgi:hypothetical protein